MVLKLLLESHAENGGNSSQLCNAVLTLLSRNPKHVTQLTQYIVHKLINKGKLLTEQTFNNDSLLKSSVRTDDSVESIFHSNNFICTWISCVLEYYGASKVKQCCKEVINMIKRATWKPNFWVNCYFSKAAQLLFLMCPYMKESHDEPEKIFKQVEKVVKITKKLLTAINQTKWSE